MNLPKSKGFTLIELLIVISIVAILTGIVVNVINITEYQKQARDARRINDILSIQTAITNAVVDNGIEFSATTNCSDCNSQTGSISTDGTGWVKFTNKSGRGLKDFISNLPKDPINTGVLKFSYFSDGNGFELNAVLESERYKHYAEIDGGNDPNVYERGWDLEIN